MSQDKQHFWDKPANVRLFFRVFYVICAGLFVVDFIVHRHIAHPWERLWGFHALYGFVAIVVLIQLAKGLRRLVMRKEDYYDDLGR